MKNVKNENVILNEGATNDMRTGAENIVTVPEKVEVEEKQTAKSKKRSVGRPPKKDNIKVDDKTDSIEENTDNTVSEVLNAVDKEESFEPGEQYYAVDLKDYVENGYLKRAEPNRPANALLYKKITKYLDSIVPFLLKSMGLNYKNIPLIYALILISRLVLLPVKNILVIEASGPGTGKTRTLSNLGDYSLISEEVSKADLTGDKRYSLDKNALLKKPLLQIDEAGNISLALGMVGVFKAISSQEEYSNNGKNSTGIALSIFFSGNPASQFFNFGEKSLNTKQCIENLRELTLSLVENFDPALIDRAIAIPGFLLSPIEDEHTLKKDEKIPDIHFRSDVPDEVKIFKKFGLNVHTLWNTYMEFRDEPLLPISKEIKNELKDTTARSIEVVRKFYSGLKRIFDPGDHYSKERDLGLQELAVIYRNYTSNKYKPLNTGYVRYLLADMAKMVIEKDEIEEIYVYDHRILLKPLGENKCYKVALDTIGQEENQAEYDFYYSCPEDIKVFLSKIDSIDSVGNVLVQEWLVPFSTSKALRTKEQSKLEKKIISLEKQLTKERQERIASEKRLEKIIYNLIFQMEYNLESMFMCGKTNFCKEAIFDIDEEHLSLPFETSLKDKLQEVLPDLNTYQIKNYDISSDKELKFINFYNLKDLI